MKAFKITSKILLIVAAVLFVASLILPATSTENELDSAYMVLVQLNSIIIASAGVGIFLMFAKNDTAKKIGNGLTVAAFVAGMFCAVSIMTAMGEMAKEELADPVKVPVGAVLMIVAAVLLVAHYAFAIASYIVSKNGANVNPAEDARIKCVKEWKQLETEGIITKEEFEEKRVQILGLKPQDK